MRKAQQVLHIFTGIETIFDTCLLILFLSPTLLLYELNALDQTAMITALQQMGNTQAEFINAFGKGYRIEGFRHPHSWSIIDPEELLQWINGQLK
jgi:hypothetical protein